MKLTKIYQLLSLILSISRNSQKYHQNYISAILLPLAFPIILQFQSFMGDKFIRFQYTFIFIFSGIGSLYNQNYSKIFLFIALLHTILFGLTFIFQCYGICKMFHRKFIPIQICLIQTSWQFNLQNNIIFFAINLLGEIFIFFSLFAIAEIYFILYNKCYNYKKMGIYILFSNLILQFTLFCVLDLVQFSNIMFLILIMLNYTISMIKKSHSSIFVSSGVCTLSSFILFFIQNKFHVFSLVYCIFSLFLLIIVEIAPRTLFIGSASPPDVADFASTLEDEDTRSGEASYYYWAFHLLMMQAACYMSQVYSFSGPRVLYGVNFGFGVAGSFVFLLYLAWTAFLPVVLKNRIFE